MKPVVAAVVSLFIFAVPALAQDAAAPAVTPAPKPAPYSLPWQLRPTTAGNVVRSDTAFAFYQGTGGQSGLTTATMLLVSYKLLPNFAPMVRLAYVNNQAPDGTSGSALVNPVLGATYVFPLGPDMRLAAFLGLAFPLGMGGGDDRDPATFGAARSGILARSAMDNAMFAVNDFTVFPGVGFSYTRGGFTFQAEATVLQLTRVKGETVQPDPARTNFTSGLHVGYFVHPMVSVGAELRHQRWIVPATNTAAAAMHNTTFAIGPRFHFKVGDGLWLRPGLAYATALDQPMAASNYQIVQLDIPVAF